MLNFLIWVILIYFALMLIWRYLIPFLMKRYVRKMEKRFREYTGEEEIRHKKNREGEVDIQYIPEEEEKPSPPSDIEYVDFEEINDRDSSETK